MKTGLLFFVFLVQVVAAQPVALLDRGFKNPLTVTQELTFAHLHGKKFPIYTADLDSVIRVAETLANYVNTGLIRGPETKILAAGNSQFAVATQRAGVSNTYSISLQTRSGEIGAVLELVNWGDGPKKALQKLQIFLDYLKNNRHMALSEKNRF